MREENCCLKLDTDQYVTAPGRHVDLAPCRRLVKITALTTLSLGLQFVGNMCYNVKTQLDQK